MVQTLCDKQVHLHHCSPDGIVKKGCCQCCAQVDDEILKHGLMGVGIGAAVVGVGLALLFGGRR